MKRLRKLIVAATALCAVAGSAAAQEVKVGVVLSNTGTFAFVGAPVINAIRLAHEEMVAANFFGATKVTLMVEDNRSDKQEALTLINRMATRDNAVMIIGPVSTGEAMAAAPLAVDLKIPLFTTATAPDVLKAGPWIFKSTETAEQFMTPLGKYVAETVKPKSCTYVFIRDNEGYVRQKDILRDVMKAGGVAVAGEESILAATRISLRSPPRSWPQSPTASTSARLRNRARISSFRHGRPACRRIPCWSAIPEWVPRAISTPEENWSREHCPAEFVPTGVNELGKKSIENYTKKYRNAPNSWAAVGYSMMLIAGNAIKNAGPNPTREAVREAMAKTKNLPVVIGQGTFSLDDNRIPSFGAAVLQIKDGKWVRP